MNVKVININPEYERILTFLYPTYAFTDSPAVLSKFITHRDIKSKRERESLDIRFDDCIFISSQIFDEVWDEDMIKEKAIEFARLHFKSRKKTIPQCTDNFIDDVINFMFGVSSEEETSLIYELFEAFGSVSFVKEYFQKSKQVPIPVLNSALNTFITKVINSDTSVYYKKKNLIYGGKIKANLESALSSFLLREKDSYGLSIVKFYTDLYK